jgi:hypothetical protein
MQKEILKKNIKLMLMLWISFSFVGMNKEDKPYATLPVLSEWQGPFQ